VLDGYVENSDAIGSAACGYDALLPGGALAGRRPESVNNKPLQTISPSGLTP